MKESIRDEAGKIDWENMDQVIDFYESNNLYFSNFKNNDSPEFIIDVIHIKQRYIEALDTKKRYTKAEPILTDIDILLQKIIDNEVYSKLHERYLFLSGLICGRLKKRQESLEYFIELRKIDPENDLYKDWYLSLRASIYQTQFTVIGYCGTGLIFLDIFLDLFFNFGTNKYLFLLAVILMVVGFSYPYIHKTINRIKGIE